MRTRADHIKGVVQDKLVYLRDISGKMNPSDLGTKGISAPDEWKYLACLLHGKIRLGLPRSDFTSSDLRILMETTAYHSQSKLTKRRPVSSAHRGSVTPRPSKRT